MSDPISGIAGNALSSHMKGAAKQMQQQETGGRSFESVLQNGGQGSNAGATGTPAPQAAGSELSQVPEKARLDLLQRVGGLPPGTPNVLALLPELLNAKSQTGWLKEAMSKMGNTPKATDLRGTLGHVENEWSQFDTILKSGKDLSQGDLLVLQGRLYQLTQHIEVLSKVVDQMTGGIKTILNTNV